MQPDVDREKQERIIKLRYSSTIQHTFIGEYNLSRESAKAWMRAHLKSICAIPELIRDSVFIEELPNTKGTDRYDSYRYYVAGINIDGENYTAKIVVGVKGDSKYYDHRLSEIEKGSLIDILNRLSNSVDAANDPELSGIKDSKLLAILQVVSVS